MQKSNYIILLFLLALMSCKNDKELKPTLPTEGNTIISVDESFAPIIEEQATAFMNRFPKAKIKINFKAEDRCWQDLDDSTVDMIITTKMLTQKEIDYYKSINKYEFSRDVLAYDAMVLIVNKASSDTMMTEKEVKQMLLGQKFTAKKIVVDGTSATSTVRYIMDSILRQKEVPKTIKGLKSNEDVIDFVSKTPNAVGFIGYSWIGNPDNPKHQVALKKVSIVNMQSRRDEKDFVKPNYGNIAKGRYPYYRNITYILKENVEGVASGLRNWMMYERGQLVFKRAGFFPGKMNFKIRKVNLK